MPRITSISLADAQARLRSRRAGYDDRAVYRDAIIRMTAERMLELEPDSGETLRKLRLNVNRAAREVGRDVGYGESDSGSLLVWLAEAKKVSAPRKVKASSAAV